ncbi:MAG: anaerobic glycerol-3-phosphate dehydrogenase subunit A [Muribaculaceae bacterium]
MATNVTKHYDVIVIGGGITGAGTARDCAMRGLSTLLVERFDLTTGATGRNHGLLHSGARYAVTDSLSAEECISENMILRRIARHCVEPTDGLFITLPEDDLAYQNTFVEACHKAGINAQAIDPSEALAIEPAVNKDIIGAVRVPDGAVDPFRLTMANVYDARLHHAQVLTYHEVTAIIKDANRVVGVTLFSHITHQTINVHANLVINAAGIWGQHIAQLADVKLSMFPAKGSLLVYGHRVNNVVINRCRKPANADILVPGDTVCVIGTTSDRVPFETVDDMCVTQEEVDLLMREGEKMAPCLGSTRILRAYAGVRPLVTADNDPTGRNISRGIVLLDHETRDNTPGLITITGGKLMTYRLMAEWATDLACKKLNRNVSCATATTPLAGSEPANNTESKKTHIMSHSMAQRAAQGRHGTLSNDVPANDAASNALVCECEQVTVGEINYAINRLNVHNLHNLRRRTRLAMGTCQGQLCLARAAGLIAKAGQCSYNALDDLASAINERWHGMYPVAWAETLSEAQLTATIYQDLCGINGNEADPASPTGNQQAQPTIQ